MRSDEHSSGASGLAAGLAMTAALLGCPAQAAPPDAILIEIRVGAERVEQRGVSGGFVDGWGSGLVAGPALASLINAEMSRPAGTMGGLIARIRTAMQEVQEKRHARRGDWAAIIKLLKPIHDDFESHVQALATDIATRDAAFDLLVMLSWAQSGAHDTEAALETVSELIRSFSDKRVTESMRGPGFQKFYDAAVAAEARRAKFTLAIAGQPAYCSVYLNEFKIGSFPRADRKGAAKLEKKVSPGRYRVFADCGGGRQSRVHEINVGGDLSISIDVDFESALQAGGDAVVLAFRSEAERRANEARYAGTIGRTLRARRVVTLGVQDDAPTSLPALVGRVIDPANDVQIVTHSVTVPAGASPPSSDSRELAAKLRRKETAPQLQTPIALATTATPIEPKAPVAAPAVVVEPPAHVAGGDATAAPPAMTPVAAAAEPPRDLYWLHATSVVLGAASLAVGVYSYFHFGCNIEAEYLGGRCAPTSEGRVIPVFTLVTGGVALLTGAAALAAVPLSRLIAPRSFAIAVMPSASGVAGALSMRF